MITILAAAVGCEESSEDLFGMPSDLDANTTSAVDDDQDSDYDEDHEACQDRSTRIGPTACGENGLGRLEQKRKGNTWIDTALCRENKSIGGPCRCDGLACVWNQDNDMSFAGNLIGCDNLPDDWPGAVKTCLHSNIDASPTPTYYPNGYCSLIAVKCTGPKRVCQSVASSETSFDAFTTCPAGMVMLTYSSVKQSGILDIEARLDHKACFQGCDCDADCRGKEADARIQNAPAQYRCIKKKGIGFCADFRNVRGRSFAVQQF